MPNCTFLFHRHSGIDRDKVIPSTFVAEKLKPLIEGRMTNGHALHIVHDRIHDIPLNDEMRRGFDGVAKNEGTLVQWEAYNKRWLKSAKKALAKANHGINNKQLSRDLSPDAALILDTNWARRDTIMNYVGFPTPEAAIEYTIFKIHMDLSRRKARLGDFIGSVEQLMEAQNALACCNLLRDVSLIDNIGRMGIDVVVLRNLNHLYLANLEDCDIPVTTHKNIPFVNFSDFVETKGVNIIPIPEEVLLSFGEKTVNYLCSGGIDKEKHRKLALKEIMLSVFLDQNDCYNKPEMWQEMIARVDSDYEELRAEIYGSSFTY
jgi:hypothetical protein